MEDMLKDFTTTNINLAFDMFRIRYSVQRLETGKQKDQFSDGNDSLCSFAEYTINISEYTIYISEYTKNIFLHGILGACNSAFSQLQYILITRS